MKQAILIISVFLVFGYFHTEYRYKQAQKIIPTTEELIKISIEYGYICRGSGIDIEECVEKIFPEKTAQK